MSVQSPVAPHRIAVVDIDIPFWRMVAIIIKWTIAAIPAAIIVSIIFTVIALLVAAPFFAGMMGGMMSKWM